MLRQVVRVTVAVAALLGVAAPAQAGFIFGFTGLQDAVLSITTTDGVFNINSFDTGWYRNDGFHTPTNTNYIICVTSGDCGSTDPVSNNFSAFRLGTVTGTFLSATYNLVNPANGATIDAQFSLWDFGGNIDNLLAGTGGPGAFTDLGSGVLFGSRPVGFADNGTTVITALNGAALAAISSALSANGGSGFFVIGGSAGQEVPVPEPATLSLLGLGMAAGYARRRRARR